HLAERRRRPPSSWPADWPGGLEPDPAAPPSSAHLPHPDLPSPGRRGAPPPPRVPHHRPHFSLTASPPPPSSSQIQPIRRTSHSSTTHLHRAQPRTTTEPHRRRQKPSPPVRHHQGDQIQTAVDLPRHTLHSAIRQPLTTASQAFTSIDHHRAASAQGQPLGRRSPATVLHQEATGLSFRSTPVMGKLALLRGVNWI
ncbi:hypothetical protein Dimus_008173, partial [Dionaea muscipula]